ncbi:MAG: ammonium transporter, partial [Eggerthellaceae bacterium]|nr:ammonium transporter [Eggerthellaceae bacterium]
MYDTGSTAFMLVCTMLVALMTPGLSFFYGGLSRRKNVVNTMMMVVAVIGVVGVMWIACGWSFAYGGDGSSPFFGGFDQLGCLPATSDMLAETASVPEGATYPAIIDIGFQMAFAMITCAIITGAVAGRMKFGAMVVFIAIWVCVIYAPLAHMVWGGDGSLIGDMIGALDFAGGDVVHIS